MKKYNKNIMKTKKLLAKIFILLISISLLIGCGAKSKEQQTKSQEFRVESKKQATRETNTSLSKKEQKRIEKRVLEIVDILEKRYKKELGKDIRKKEDEVQIEKERQQAEKLSKELIDIGKAGIPTLINVIKDKRKNYLFRAALMRLIVNEIEDKRLIQPLMDIVKDRREDIIVRNEAERILKEEFGKIPPKIILSEREKKKIKKKVLRIIKRMEWKCKVLRMLSGGKELDSMGVALVTASDWEQLELIGKPAIPRMTEVLKDKKRDWIVRYYMVYLFGTSMKKMIDGNVVKVMIDVLEDKDEKLSLRMEIADKLGNIGDSQAVEPLIRILEDREEMINTELGNYFLLRAIISLGRLKDKRAKDVLIDIIKETMGSDKLQGPALAALKNIGEEEDTIELAIWMLNTPECRFKHTAADILGDFKGNKKAIETLKKVYEELKDEKNDFKGAYPRCSIIKALGEQEEIEFLIQALNDKDQLIIRDVARALVKIGDKRAVEPLIETFKNSDDKRFLGHLLAKLGDKKVIKPLEEALKDPKNIKIKHELALALGNIGDEKTVDLLIEELEEAIKNKDKELTFGCAFALCKIGDKKAIPYVEKALKKGTWGYQKEWVVSKLKELKSKD
jgi:HEAT repeat protein